jgi:hypothetical protein
MCLTAEAFGLFLSIITLNNVSVEDKRVTIHTPDQDVYWINAGEKWCLARPEHAVLAALATPDTARIG